METTHTTDTQVEAGWWATKAHEIAHSGLAWAWTGMLILLAYFLTFMHASVTGEVSVFAWGIWALGLLAAVFIIPAWALAWLGQEGQA